MAEANIVEIQLRRMDTSQAWGFRLRGGVDQGVPLHVEQMNPKGRSAHAGLAVGDIILAICRTDVQRMTHEQVKSEILRAGNEIDLVVHRGPVPGMPAGVLPQAAPASPQRVQVVEEPTMRMGGPTYKNVQPKTYKVLEQELPASNAVPGSKPASIFDRKRTDRSGYLQASGSTIQKAYGERP